MESRQTHSTAPTEQGTQEVPAEQQSNSEAVEASARSTLRNERLLDNPNRVGTRSKGYGGPFRFQL